MTDFFLVSLVATFALFIIVGILGKRDKESEAIFFLCLSAVTTICAVCSGALLAAAVKIAKKGK